MLHINIYENRSTGSRDQNFMALYHIWTMKPSDYVTNIKLTYFHFLVPKSSNTKFGQKRSSVSEKNKF